MYVDQFESVRGILFHRLVQDASAVARGLVAVEGRVGEGEYDGVDHHRPASIAALAGSEGAVLNVQLRTHARVYRTLGGGGALS